MKPQHTYLFALYDGIENSVFQSQVLLPLLELIDQNEELEILLVTFEQYKIDATKIMQLIRPHKRLHVIMCRKIPFIGKMSLYFAVHQFKNLLKKFQPQQITARGPLAGSIVLQALQSLFAQHSNVTDYAETPIVTIQARGLCAEEYRYAHKKEWFSGLKQYWHHFIYRQLNEIEQTVFGQKAKHDRFPLAIEAVSPALKEYLTEHWRAEAVRITIAQRDIPKTISPEQVSAWRQAVRQELDIPADAIVYCYSGSFKPWQCAQESVDYVIEQYQNNAHSFLLILSQDKKAFENVLKQSKLPESNYRLLSVKPLELNRFLATADFGLLFREQDIINWVSRPTKMLEYQAVGLKIIHNSTIALLTEKN